MKINWTVALDDTLAPAPSDDVWPDFHEASKLSAVVAREQSAGFGLRPDESFVMSRSFRQGDPRTATPLPDAAPGVVELRRAMQERRSSRALSAPVELGDLTVVLEQALGPTVAIPDPDTGLTNLFRAWPSAGGLYPLDIYLLVRDVDGLAPGCYHVNTVGRRLEPLPGADGPQTIRDAYFWQEFATRAAAVVVLVAVFERSIAKYGERGYRFCLLDAGHAAQNVLLVAAQQELHAVAVGGFDDDGLAHSLGLDGIREAAVHTVLLGGREREREQGGSDER